jgi:hypothetical protein
MGVTSEVAGSSDRGQPQGGATTDGPHPRGSDTTTSVSPPAQGSQTCVIRLACTPLKARSPIT